MGESPLRSYMKSTIAARHGDMTGSLNLFRQAMSKINWETRKPVLSWDGWLIYLDDMLAYGEVYVDGEGKRLITTRETWETLHYYSPAIPEFVSEMTSGASGMKFVTMDAGKYAVAAKAQRQAEGTDKVQVKDAIFLLEQRTQSLIIQAASLNSEATELQLQTFYGRYATLQEEFEELRLRFDALESSISLAGTAVMDLVS